MKKFTLSQSSQTFGGLIYPSDFNTECRQLSCISSHTASRIFSDWRFDEMCRKNAENRDKENNL